MDAFQRAVDEARRHLGISVAEMLRRAGFPKRSSGDVGLTVPGARYHLDTSANATRSGGHRIPPELVTKLAAVLPIDEDELRRAAHIAAGFTTEPGDGWDMPTMLARYLDDKTVTEAAKQQTIARVLKVIADAQ